MRFALVLAGLMLVTGCSQVPVAQQGPAELTPITPSRSAAASTSHPTAARSTAGTSAPAPSAAPPAGSSADAAIAWVEGGPPVDDADFRVALRGGTTVSLGGDTAFVTPSGISCMTDTQRSAGELSCLVSLANPLPQPADVYGAWKAGWVDFDGAGVRVGSAHGDPGPFARGSGAPLPPGKSVAFGDFRCRADTTALVCVNYARKTGVRYSDDGIGTYGCTRQSPPAAGIGEQYSC